MSTSKNFNIENYFSFVYTLFRHIWALSLTRKADSHIVRVRKGQFCHFLITSPHPYDMTNKDEHAVRVKVTEGNQ